MKEIISFKIINLPHRVDRREQCNAEIEYLNDIFSIEYFNAKYIENSGARGCALSHAMALADFLFNCEKQYVLILEDDFKIKNPMEFALEVKNIIDNSECWDVFLLGHNKAIPIAQSKSPAHFKVINSQTTSGYLVTRKYAIELIKIFFRSAELLASNESLPLSHKEITKHFYCCDILWKELQLTGSFLTTFPALISQRESYSDVEKIVVDYNC